jgi:hypothetical protein
MRYSIRKQTHDDFKARVGRVDPAFARSGGRETQAAAAVSPLPWIVAGFGWMYLAAGVARNRDAMAASLVQGSLPVQAHAWIMGAMAALLGITAILMVAHAARFALRRRGNRGTSGAILGGALGALVLSYMPAGTLQTGLGLLDDNSRGLILAANGTVKETVGLDFQGVAFVTALNR